MKGLELLELNKTLVNCTICFCLGLVPILAMGQSLPHTFSSNTAAKAIEVNENFKYLLERFGTRKTTVNCYSGESITTALQNYNHIVISGICSEILHLEATSMPHRLVILEGSSSSSDGINANGVSPPQTDSSYTSNAVVYAHGSITIKISRLKLTGGTYGVEGWLGPSVIIENALIENNTTHGIALWGNASGWIKNSTIQNNGEHAILGWSSYVDIDSNTISGHTNNQSITITRSGSAYIKDNTITNGKHAGISIDRGASADIISNTIQSAENGISVQDSSHALLKSNTVKNNSRNGLVVENNASVILDEGNTFSNNTEYGINMYNGGSLNMWCDAQLTSPTTISGNTEGTIQFGHGVSAKLCNLTLSSPTRGINVGRGAALYMQNITITNSQKEGLGLWGSTAIIDNVTITGSAEEGIKIVNGGILEISNSTISGGSKDGIYARMGAILNMNNVSIANNQNDGVSLWGAKASIGNSTITGNTKEGIRLNNGFMDIYNTTISGNTINGIASHQQSAINLAGGVIIENNGYGIGMHDSTLFQYDVTSSYIRNNTAGYEISAIMSSIGLENVTVGGTSGSNEISLSRGSILVIGTGTSITGTIDCDGSLITGKFIYDKISLSPTTSEDC